MTSSTYSMRTADTTQKLRKWSRARRQSGSSELTFLGDLEEDPPEGADEIPVRRKSSPSKVPFRKRKKSSNKVLAISKTYFDFETAKNELIACCLTHMIDTYKVNKNRLRGLEILDIILKNQKKRHITHAFAVHMTWACISCVHHFIMKLNAKRAYFEWWKRRDVRRALSTFDRMLDRLCPKMDTLVINATVSFFEEADLWETEHFCLMLLKRILLLTDRCAEIIIDILVLAENNLLTNMENSKHILAIVYDIEESIEWRMINETLLKKVLDMHYKSVTPHLGWPCPYYMVAENLDLYLRGMLRFFTGSEVLFVLQFFLGKAVEEDLSEDFLLAFVELTVYTCERYRDVVHTRQMSGKLMKLMFQLTSSDSLSYSLMGLKLLRTLADTHGNVVKLESPRIFYKECNYGLKIRNIDDEPSVVLFIKHYRRVLHAALVSATNKHGSEQTYVQHAYALLGVLAVSIPCSYTAATIVCQAMVIQDFALQGGMLLTCAHRLHATVLSLMSLVAYVHNADIFYNYIITIIDRRANYAPQLNPPLLNHYKYAQHYLLWDNPDLFFEHWETRYGLMKCFAKERLRKDKTMPLDFSTKH